MGGKLTVDSIAKELQRSAAGRRAKRVAEAKDAIMALLRKYRARVMSEIDQDDLDEIDPGLAAVFSALDAIDALEKETK